MMDFALRIGVRELVDNHIHQGCHVGHIHLSIEVDAPISEVTLDISEIFPLARRPVCTQTLG